MAEEKPGTVEAFLFELDIQQTKPDLPHDDIHPAGCQCKACREDRRRLGPVADGRVPLTPQEETFRHSGWKATRARVRRALVSAHASAARLDRFENCGSDCTCEYSPSTGRTRIRGTYCGDRFCVPCAKARSKKIERGIRARCVGLDPLFLTLTLKSSSLPLSEVLDHLLQSFTRLRNTLLWRRAVRGGVAVVEIKLGSGSGRWHVHLHVLADASFLDAFELSKCWKKASAGSFIVDVQRVRNSTKGIGYVAKYAAKGWSAGCDNDPDRLLECLVALKGRRLLITFGSWSKLEDEEDLPDPGDWKRVGRLCDIVDASERGEVWAKGLLRLLMGLGGCEEEQNSAARPPPRSQDV